MVQAPSPALLPPLGFTRSWTPSLKSQLKHRELREPAWDSTRSQCQCSGPPGPIILVQIARTQALLHPALLPYFLAQNKHIFTPTRARAPSLPCPKPLAPTPCSEKDENPDVWGTHQELTLLLEAREKKTFVS